MKKILLFIVMALSVNYLFAYDYFNQSVGILSADVTTGKSLFYNNVSLKIGISDNKFYLSLDKGSMSEAITFYVDKVEQADNEMIIFSTSYAYDYLTMKSAKQNTFRGAWVGIVPVILNKSMFDKNAQGTVETVGISIQHEQTRTEQRYYIILNGSSSPYNDVLQAFIKAYNKKNNSTNTSQNSNLSIEEDIPDGYVDLGLPSGTYWKKENEKGYYSFDDVTKKFGSSVPTEYQLRELYYKCEWRWENNGYKVIGPNGNSIFLPLTGCYLTFDKKLLYRNEAGDYWSSATSPRNSGLALVFNKNERHIGWFNRKNKFAVRLVTPAKR